MVTILEFTGKCIVEQHLGPDESISFPVIFKDRLEAESFIDDMCERLYGDLDDYPTEHFVDFNITPLVDSDKVEVQTRSKVSALFTDKSSITYNFMRDAQTFVPVIAEPNDIVVAVYPITGKIESLDGTNIVRISDMVFNLDIIFPAGVKMDPDKVSEEIKTARDIFKAHINSGLNTLSYNSRKHNERHKVTFNYYGWKHVIDESFDEIRRNPDFKNLSRALELFKGGR